MGNPCKYFVSTGIGEKWSTYIRKPSGRLKRVVTKFLPERDTKEEAERDLQAWLKR